MAARTLQAACLALILAPSPARAEDQPPVWLTDGEGRRFRVRFDPGQRLFAGAGAMGLAATGSASFEPAVEVGLALRAPPPLPDAEVFWKRDHRLAQLRLRRGGDGLVLD